MTTINEITLQEREKTLARLDRFICEYLDNDNVWLEWITYGVPDQNSDDYNPDDYKWIAEDDEMYNDTIDLWCELSAQFSKKDLENLAKYLENA
jgi:hypothetical protein